MTRLIENRTSLIKDIIFLITTGVAVCASVLMLWKHPYTLSFILIFAISLQIYYYRKTADIIMMISAALLGTPSEILCVKTGIWTYVGPDLIFGIPIWIPLIWGFLFCFFRRFAQTTITITNLLPYLSGKTVHRAAYTLLRGIILLYITYTLLHINRRIAIVYSGFLIAVIFCRHRRFDVLIFLIGGFFGTMGEYLCMKQGYWIYHTPYFKSIGLPISLPIAWGLSAVITGKIAGLSVFNKTASNKPETHHALLSKK